MRPAASVRRVLPVPAWPSSVTKSIAGFMSRLSAKFCSRLRAVMPQTLFLPGAAARGVARLEVGRVPVEVVVGLADRQVGGNVAVARLGLQEQAPPRVVGLVACGRNPLRYGRLRVAHDVVQTPARLARVACDFG